MQYENQGIKHLAPEQNSFYTAKKICFALQVSQTLLCCFFLLSQTFRYEESLKHEAQTKPESSLTLMSCSAAMLRGDVILGDAG